jgi:hypothetical protein
MFLYNVRIYVNQKSMMATDGGHSSTKDPMGKWLKYTSQQKKRYKDFF